jgi:hypothetical protein
MIIKILILTDNSEKTIQVINDENIKSIFNENEEIKRKEVKTINIRKNDNEDSNNKTSDISFTKLNLEKMKKDYFDKQLNELKILKKIFEKNMIKKIIKNMSSEKNIIKN